MYSSCSFINIAHCVESKVELSRAVVNGSEVETVDVVVEAPRTFAVRDHDGPAPFEVVFADHLLDAHLQPADLAHRGQQVLACKVCVAGGSVEVGEVLQPAGEGDVFEVGGDDAEELALRVVVNEVVQPSRCTVLLHPRVDQVGVLIGLAVGDLKVLYGLNVP